MCFVNCHFAAHLEAVSRRNADFSHIYRSMAFSRSSNLLSNASGMLRYLFLICSLALSTYLCWMLYTSGLPWVICLAAGVSSTAQGVRGTEVCISGADFYVYPNSNNGLNYRAFVLTDGRVY